MLRKIIAVQPLENYRLLVTFDNGEKRIGDITPLLERPVFSFLREKEAFCSVYLSYGALTWRDRNGNEFDICPDKFYTDSLPA